MIKYEQKDIDRLTSKIFVVTEGKHVGCHETTYAKNNGGYSALLIKCKFINVHRLMYQIHHPDEDINDKVICHRCDNPACVNPEHLFSGSHQDNVTDKVNKGRQHKGSDCTGSKLIIENVIEIINLTLSGHFTSREAIAKHYNVHLTCIRNIINQKTWKHITKDYDMVKVKSLLYNNHNKGSKSLISLFDDDQIRKIRIRIKNGETQLSIAAFYGVHKDTINKIATGKSYQDVV